MLNESSVNIMVQSLPYEIMNYITCCMWAAPLYIGRLYVKKTCVQNALPYSCFTFQQRGQLENGYVVVSIIFVLYYNRSTNQLRISRRVEIMRETAWLMHEVYSGINFRDTCYLCGTHSRLQGFAALGVIYAGTGESGPSPSAEGVLPHFFV